MIRRFEIKDFNEVLAIESNVFKERENSIYNILGEIDTDNFLVAVENNTIVGYIIGYVFSENEGRIFSIAVKPEYRNKRIGTKLLHNLLAIFIRNSLKCVYLEVRISNKKAQQMYYRAGFKLYGIKKKYYLNGETGLFMRKKLQKFSHNNIHFFMGNFFTRPVYKFSHSLC